MELNKDQIKVIFITGISILFIVLLFFIIGILSISHSNKTNTNINISAGFNSIKEIVEHHGCKYKNDTYEEHREYPEEINLVFKHQLYENDNSNEEIFNKIIKDIASFIRFTNFKMIDTEKDITIEVVCQNGTIYQIKINGQEDYFIYMDSQLEITKYSEIELTSIIPNIESLNYLIDNNWTTDVNFGTRESVFKNYYIFFDEGVKYKKIGSNIYNVVFTDKFQGEVVNNIQVGTSLSSIKERLGKPAFEDQELKVLGYKGKDMYVFFTEKEISIYKNTRYDYKEFWKLVDKFLKEDMEFKDFMNELTYIWKDYSEYSYSSDYMFIAYPNRGIEVKLKYDDISGIVIYNNISEDLKTIRKYLEHTEFISRLKLDSVFEAEKRRIEQDKKLKEDCAIGEKEEKTKSMWFYYYFEKDNQDNTIKVDFVSKDEEYANRELNESIYSYMWITDNLFVFSIYNKGIYAFDVTTGSKIKIDEYLNGNYIIENFKDNILKYDGKEMILEY